MSPMLSSLPPAPMLAPRRGPTPSGHNPYLISSQHRGVTQGGPLAVLPPQPFPRPAVEEGQASEQVTKRPRLAVAPQPHGGPVIVTPAVARNSAQSELAIDTSISIKKVGLRTFCPTGDLLCDWGPIA